MEYIGEFKITYCWLLESDRNTSTGVITTEGRMKAVNPSMILYGSEVLIDGYVSC